MKYNLMVTYCNLLSFYMLLRVEAKNVSDHPVVKRLIHVKLLLEKLRPLDQKLTYQVDKLVRQAVLGEVEGPINDDDQRLQFKPNMKLMNEADKQDSEAEDIKTKHDEGDSESEDDNSNQQDSGSSEDEKPLRKKVTSQSLGTKRGRPIGMESDSDTEAAKKKTNNNKVYRASKLNPMHYQETVDKQEK